MESESVEINPSTWRRGQEYIYKDKNYIIRRTGAGMYLAFGIVEETFQTGFTMRMREIVGDIDESESTNIDEEQHATDESNEDTSINTDEEMTTSSMKKDQNIHPRNEEIQQDDYYKDHMYGMTQAIGHARTFRWSAAMHLKTVAKGKQKSRSVIVWGDESNTKAYFEDDGVTLLRVEFTPQKKQIDATELDATTLIYIFSDVKIEGKVVIPLKQVRIIRARSMDFGQGRSAIDPYLDALFALACLYEMVGIWAIRSVGVPIFTADESLWDPQSSALKTEIMAVMKNYGINSRMLFPAKIAGTESKFELYTPGDNPAFDTAHKVILSEVSIGTGIPQEKLLGNPVGLRSTEENQRNWGRAIGAIESTHNQDYEWMHMVVYDIEDDFYLEVNPYEELDEIKQLDVKAKQFKVLSD